VVLEVLLKVKKRKEGTVIAHIRKHKRKFPKTQKVERYGEYGNGSKYYVLVTYDAECLLSDTDVKKLEAKYAALQYVERVTINQAVDAYLENISTKNCHFVLDVDSTLTTGRGTIQSKVRSTFHDMKEDGHRVYLASGRDMDRLRHDIVDFGAESYGIAENGGILLGFGRDGFLPIGERGEPDRVLKYMKAKCGRVSEDIQQGMRLTERIFRATIGEQRFRAYVKKSKAKVSVFASKDSYHVAKEGVDKGFALEKLKSKLRLGPDDVVRPYA